jgi:hypothetical protein
MKGADRAGHQQMVEAYAPALLAARPQLLNAVAYGSRRPSGAYRLTSELDELRELITTLSEVIGSTVS